MFDGLQQEFLLLVAAAFVFGWLVAKVGAFLSRRIRERQRDPRDDRIRSLEAEHRIAIGEVERTKDSLESARNDLTETQSFLVQRDQALQEQMEVIAQLRADLKDSVKKTRELRTELQDRATESVRSEVKLREVETELEVSRASTDMIATGVLDYAIAAEGEDDDLHPLSATI
jgi:chromosome segregation ATPase